jgi:hypothetical protein
MVQYMQINKCDVAHKQNQGKNHMIISKVAHKAFDKIQSQEWDKGVQLSQLLFNIVLEFLARIIRQENRLK